MKILWKIKEKLKALQVCNAYSTERRHNEIIQKLKETEKTRRMPRRIIAALEQQHNIPSRYFGMGNEIMGNMESLGKTLIPWQGSKEILEMICG